MQTGESPEWAAGKQDLERMLGIIDRNHDSISTGPFMATILTGDPNFAHCAWNHFGGLDILIASGLIDRVSKIITTSEPLGRLDEIFPELESKNIQRKRSWEVRELNTGDLFVPVGGTRLTKAVRSRILALAGRRLSTRATAISEKLTARRCRPTFWISVKTRYRTAENQMEFIGTVLHDLAAAFPFCNILIDGHSLPMDLEYNLENNAAALAQIVSADRAMIEQAICYSGCDRPSNDAMICEAAGLTILDSIFLAQYADFYVCHHGTVQHKIGWFHRVPGVVHTNKAFTEISPARWVASQSDCAVEPIYVESKWITDLESPSDYSHYPAGLRLENYMIEDIPAVVRFIIEAAQVAVRH